jgi:hypothetical protein
VEQELLILPEHLSSPPVFSGVPVTRSLVLYVNFVDHFLSFFFWPLCCLFFFDIRILIAPLVSSNSSWNSSSYTITMRCLSHYKVYTVVGIVWHRYIYIRFGEIRRARVTVMMLNATFNNISVISWLSVLLQGDARVSGENHLPVVCQWQTLSHNVVSITPRHEHYFGWYALIAQVGVNPTTIRPWAQRPFRVCLQWVEARGGIVEHQFKAAFPVVPIDKICGRSLS